MSLETETLDYVLADQSFSEILEPIRRSFDECGMSEGELDALFGEV